MFKHIRITRYKMQVRKHLTETYNTSVQETDRLMTLYENDFQEALFDFAWSPLTMALAMTIGY